MEETKEPEVVPAGDAAALVVFGEEISLPMNARVQAVARAIESRGIPGLVEVTIAYASLLVHYDPLVASFDQVKAALLETGGQTPMETIHEGWLREIPTLYGGAYGIDLAFVARHLNLPEEEVIHLHSSATYLVCMLGFAPGHPYLGGLPLQLAMPRLETPRPLVPAGTVAIANQTVIYPLDSPGGWRWLGRTPLKMFDPRADPPTYLQAGDRVRFIPITEEEYLALGGVKAAA